jgi:hypothetical protein
MKKMFVFILFAAIVNCVSAQLKVYSTYVGIGGNRITFKPANPGPEIGGTDGTIWSTISFWHTQTGWNKFWQRDTKQFPTLPSKLTFD